MTLLKIGHMGYLRLMHGLGYLRPTPPRDPFLPQIVRLCPFGVKRTNQTTQCMGAYGRFVRSVSAFAPFPDQSCSRFGAKADRKRTSLRPPRPSVSAVDPTCHTLLFYTWPTIRTKSEQNGYRFRVAALGAASLCGLCPAFVLPISTPYGQNPDKMGIDLGSCGGVGLPPLWTVWPWLATKTMSADASAAGRRRGADCVLYFYPNGDYAKIPWPHMS